MKGGLKKFALYLTFGLLCDTFNEPYVQEITKNAFIASQR